MEILIARQPILNKHKRLYGYELLYRGKKELSLQAIGGNRATTSLLTSSFLTEGFDTISNNYPCFINFTEDLLCDDIIENFPKTKVVIEILEDVDPKPEIIAVCKKLKEKGYILVLDDFVYRKRIIPLLKLADIVKIDFQASPADKIHRAVQVISQYDTKLLAEKIESYDEFEQALKLGFSFFQGYFFAKPESLRIQEVASSKINLLALLAEITSSSVSKKRLTEIISTDVSLSYKLLRYLNSAYFYLVQEVTSIDRALSYLGENETKRFVTLVVISEISSEKPAELVRLAVIRAKLCELLAKESPLQPNPSELFLLGLFSLLDAMLDMPIHKVLQKISLSQDLNGALTEGEGAIAPFLDVVVSYEKRDRGACEKALGIIGVDTSRVYGMYLQSLVYADSFAKV